MRTSHRAPSFPPTDCAATMPSARGCDRSATGGVWWRRWPGSLKARAAAVAAHLEPFLPQRVCALAGRSPWRGRGQVRVLQLPRHPYRHQWRHPAKPERAAAAVRHPRRGRFAGRGGAAGRHAQYRRDGGAAGIELLRPSSHFPWGLSSRPRGPPQAASTVHPGRSEDLGLRIRLCRCSRIVRLDWFLPDRTREDQEDAR